MKKRYFIKAGFTGDGEIVATFVGPIDGVPNCKEFFYKDSNGGYKPVKRSKSNRDHTKPFRKNYLW